MKFSVTDSSTVFVELQNATVTIAAVGHDYTGTTQAATAADGTVEIANLPYGDYSYSVELTSYVSKTGTFTIDSDTQTDVSVILSQDSEMIRNVTFHVGDADNGGEAVFGARITVTNTDTNLTQTASGETDGDGNVTLSLLQGQGYVAKITAFGNYQESGEYPLDVIKNTPTQNISLNRKVSAGGFQLTVNDELDAPITDATVIINGTSHFYFGQKDAGAAGVYSFGDLPYGEYSYIAAKDGYISKTGNFVVDDNMANMIGPVALVSVNPTGDMVSVTVRVTDAGNGSVGAAGVRVVATSAADGSTVSNTTDAGGYTTLALKDGVEYTATAQGTNLFEANPGGVTFTAQAGLGEQTIGVNRLISAGGAKFYVQTRSAATGTVTTNPLAFSVTLTGISHSYTQTASVSAGMCNFVNINYGSYNYVVTNGDATIPTMSGTLTIASNGEVVNTITVPIA